jgi:two-component system nitrate/nitrite response regulator NarL
MGHDVVYKEQILPIAQDPFQNVTTVLICQNILLRTGISHILSGTRFILSDDACDNLSNLPAFTDKVPVLFLICESRTSDEYATIVDEVKSQCPSARIVLLADGMEPQAVLQVCQAGLDGFCSTTMDRHALVKALEIVMLGETFIPASIGLTLLDQLRRGQIGGMGKSIAFMPANDPAIALTKLSEREAQILRCLTQGASNKLIARELGVAEATVKVHIKAILRKVKASNRTQAAMWAAGHFNIAPEDGSLLAGE